jgi:hypothetical protein
MKEINMPVMVMDDDRLTCDLFDITSVAKTRLYADDRCIKQDITIQCDHLKLCEKIRKRMEKK